jgi:hypothetical protein
VVEAIEGLMDTEHGGMCVDEGVCAWVRDIVGGLAAGQ